MKSQATEERKRWREEEERTHRRAESEKKGKVFFTLNTVLSLQWTFKDISD